MFTLVPLRAVVLIYIHSHERNDQTQDAGRSESEAVKNLGKYSHMDLNTDPSNIQLFVRSHPIDDVPFHPGYVRGRGGGGICGRLSTDKSSLVQRLVYILLEIKTKKITGEADE